MSCLGSQIIGSAGILSGILIEYLIGHTTQRDGKSVKVIDRHLDSNRHAYDSRYKKEKRIERNRKDPSQPCREMFFPCSNLLYKALIFVFGTSGSDGRLRPASKF